MQNLFDIVSDSAVEYGITVKSRNESFKRISINGSRDAATFATGLFGAEIEVVESFIIVTLNRANKVTGWARISTGGRAATVVDNAVIAKIALDSLACGVVLAHNHPSGNTRPSFQDDAITRRVRDALALFDIKVLDHIIVTPTSDYYSYCDEGRLSQG